MQAQTLSSQPTYNQFVASCGGREIAIVRDDPLYQSLMAETVLMWVRAGFEINYRPERIPDAQPGTLTTSVPIKPTNPKRAYTRHSSKVVEFPTWSMGDRVYLNWSCLDEERRTHLSSLRTTTGTIELITREADQPIGVRFNDDPELIWFNATELSKAPVIDIDPKSKAQRGRRRAVQDDVI